MDVSQNILDSAGMLRAALRPCSTMHLIHKQLPLQQMPLQCATVGFGSLEETTAGFAESRQSIGVWGLSAVCQFSSPLHLMQNNLRMALLAVDVSCWDFPM